MNVLTIPTPQTGQTDQHVRQKPLDDRQEECLQHPTWGTPGDESAHQGDLTFVFLEKRPKSLTPRSNRQLAEGTTKGARHMLVRGELFDADPGEISTLIQEQHGKHVDERYIGPVFIGEAEVQHPEHMNHSFPATLNGCTAVKYQRDLDAEEREKRVRD